MAQLNDYRSEPIPLRRSLILTNSYVAATTILNTEGMNQLILLIDFTIGSLTTAEVKVEFSPDNTTFYQETFSSVSAGTSTESLGEHTFSGTGKYRLAIPIKDKYIKVSAKGTGTVTSSLMAIEAITGNT